MKRGVEAFFSSRSALWLAFPVGAALALSFAPFSWWLLAMLCPAYLFAAWQVSAPRRAAKLGFLFTAGTFLGGTYWIYHSVHIIGKAPVWIAVFLMLGLVAIMGGYSALLGYLIARFLPATLPLRSPGKGRVGAAVHALLILPSAWVLLEWFRGWFLSGFPWLSLGYSQIDTPLAGFAPVAGVYGISLLAALSAGALVTLVRGAKRERIAAGISLALIWGVGFFLWQRHWTEPVGPPITVAIVQGAVPQDVKWSFEYRDSTLDLYRELTLPHLGKDIILWPEAALPDVPENLRDYLTSMWRAAHGSGSTLITGLLHYGAGSDDIRNGLLSLDEELRWYDKRRLVPFGEVFPVPAFVREWMKLRDLPYTDITPGARRQPALPAAGQKLGATICYEDAYGAEQLAVLEEATLLVNVTNDAWFGDSTAAPQHLEISRMRALEAGRPLLRAANDGISALIGPEGRIEKTLPRFKPGVLTGVAQPRTGLTPYAKVGNVPVILLCVFCVGAGAFVLRRASTRSK